MSETTSKLSLFKYNTTADAKQPFSIKDCMNDNWDKLDAFATSVDTIFSSSFSSNLDKKVFSDINKELGKKLEADVLLAENGYIKFNSLVSFLMIFSRYCIKLIYEVQKRVSLCISATFCTSFQKVIQNTLFITQNNIIYSGILKY